MARARRHGLPLAATLAGFAALASPAVAAADGRGPQIVKGPYVTAFSDTTADVRFELDVPAPATVEVLRQHSGDTPKKVVDAAASALHVVHLTGLEPGKPYGYGVLAGTAAARGTFSTASANPTVPVHFVAYGDARSDAAAHAAVVRAIAADRPDFLINTGDNVAEGASGDDWNSFFQIEAPLLRSTPVFVAIGNHELYADEGGDAFLRYFGFPAAGGASKAYGTFRDGPVRFFFLNSMHDWTGGEERAWLEQALTQADAESGLAWRVVVAHHSPYSSGPHGGSEKLLAGHVPELLAAHHVDLIVSGHDHIYERGEGGGLKYVITGGGGAPLYRVQSSLAPTTRKAESTYHYVDFTVTPSEVRVIARRLDGSVLDRCGFLLGHSWDCDGPAPQAAAAPAAPPAGSAAPGRPAASPSRCSAAAGAPSGGLAGAGLVAAAAALGARRRRRG